MKNKSFWMFLLLTLLFFPNLKALKRNTSEPQFCASHLQVPERYSHLKPYLKYIPSFYTSYGDNSCGNACWHISCAKCNKGWVSVYEFETRDDGGNTHWVDEYILVCECKSDKLGDYQKENRIYDSVQKKWIYEIATYGARDCLRTWVYCPQPVIYPGYFSEEYSRYFSCFEEYLKYIESNHTCKCFWPEISKKAAIINNKAYELFRDLIENTELGEHFQSKANQENFFGFVPSPRFSNHGITVNFVCHSFFYSDYDWICRDLEFFCSENFQGRALRNIKNKIEDIRQNLAPLFLEIYNECLSQHPSERIQNELFLIEKRCFALPLYAAMEAYSDFSNASEEENYSDFNSNDLITDTPQLKFKKPAFYCSSNWMDSSYPRQNFDDAFAHQAYSKPKNLSRKRDWMKSDVLLEQGTLLNDVLLYNEAIKVLSEAILYNDLNKEAFIERAISYFETNQIELALRDYSQLKKTRFLPPFLPVADGGMRGLQVGNPYDYRQEDLEFAAGLIDGTIQGGKVATVEFIPGILSCVRGIGVGLWAFVCSPTEVSLDMVEAAQSLGDFMASHSALENLEAVVPEIKELSLNWDKFNSHTKGQKFGFIIGKYGIDIFGPGGVVKVASKYRTLKRANAVLTLEICLANQAKQEKIIEKSLECASKRALIIEEAKNVGAILVRNENVKHHVMQKKHAWDKLIKLSGNVEQDFKKVIEVLQENKITDENFFLRNRSTREPHIVRKQYKKTINNHEVEAVFEYYVDTEELFLMNGWVK